MDSNPFSVLSTSHLSHLTSHHNFSFFLSIFFLSLSFHFSFLFPESRNFPSKIHTLSSKTDPKPNTNPYPLSTLFTILILTPIPLHRLKFNSIFLTPFSYFTYFRGKEEKKSFFHSRIIDFACNSGFCSRFYFLILFSFIKNQNHFFFSLFCLWVFFFEVLGLLKSEFFSYSTHFCISILDLRLCWKYRKKIVFLLFLQLMCVVEWF